MIDIQGLDKAEVFRVLYDRARPQGLGFLHYDPSPMSVEESRTATAKRVYFDYYRGRAMKVCIAEDTFNEKFYDRDNGDGAAALVIETLREDSI